MTVGGTQMPPRVSPGDREARFVRSFCYNTGLQRTDRRTHDNNTYRSSAVSCGKKETNDFVSRGTRKRNSGRSDLAALDAEGVFDGGVEDEVLDDGRVRRDADAAADKYRHVVVDPVLLAGAERTVHVHLSTALYPH